MLDTWTLWALKGIEDHCRNLPKDRFGVYAWNPASLSEATLSGTVFGIRWLRFCECSKNDMGVYMVVAKSYKG